MQTRSLLLSFAVASCLAAAGASAAEPAAPDTGEWSCSKCPFDKGYRAAAELGGGYLDESSARFGDYTGLDEEGGYVVANAAGTYTGDSGYRMSYEITGLGLESRAVRLEGGLPGSYEYELGYRFFRFNGKKCPKITLFAKIRQIFPSYKACQWSFDKGDFSGIVFPIRIHKPCRNTVVRVIFF